VTRKLAQDLEALADVLLALPRTRRIVRRWQVGPADVIAERRPVAVGSMNTSAIHRSSDEERAHERLCCVRAVFWGR
jgi:hypothetical protein